MKIPFRRKPRRLAPAAGYNQWSATYDTQPDNPVLALESRLFGELLTRVEIEGKTVADIGCGTGRHWSEILSKHPASLIGADPSEGMIERLMLRYPNARVICTEGDRLSAISSESIDIVISTLALAHITSASGAFREWTRILRRGGSILITDFHPDAIHAGMKRTFPGPDGTIEIEQRATDLDRLQTIAMDCGLTESFLAERAIDESVRVFFDLANAVKTYRQHKGLPLVYGVHFTKP